MRGMLSFSGVEPVLDIPALVGYLSLRPAVHLTHSFYAQIAKLPPAHAMSVSRAGSDSGSTGARRMRHPYGCARTWTTLRHCEIYSTKPSECRLRSAFPIAAHISGGLDSSSVAVLAARGLRAQGKDLAAGFSWSPPLSDESPLAPNDERPRIAEISTREGIPVRFAPVTASDWVAVFDRDVSTRPAETARKELVVNRMASESGIRVLLSGWGGDEFASFNGRGFYREMFWRGRWGILSREARAETRDSRV